MFEGASGTPALSGNKWGRVAWRREARRKNEVGSQVGGDPLNLRRCVFLCLVSICVTADREKNFHAHCAAATRARS
jgi:hypothetical protein